jgi:predicted SAM-dependent methyltransferase
MDWKKKSAIIRTVEQLPFSNLIYYLLQRYVSRSIPRSPASTDEVLEIERRHLQAFRKLTGRTLPDLTFEFGAGWDLCGAIARATFGVPRQVMIDLSRLASVWQINHVINLVQPLARSEETLRKIANIGGLDHDLIRKSGITYIAPADARKTDFQDQSVDLIVSTNTLEHIPQEVIIEIMRECRRIISPGGIVSFVIDYSDHYAHADQTISDYNYIQYSRNQWAQHNHGHHYQNRLRHSDYENIFSNAGFEIVENQGHMPENGASIIDELSLSAEFLKYTREQILPTSGWFVLRVPSQ